jgi:hypothetical protein
MRRPVGCSADANGQAGRTMVHLCPQTDENDPNRPRFRIKMCHAVGDGLRFPRGGCETIIKVFNIEILDSIVFYQ